MKRITVNFLLIMLLFAAGCRQQTPGDNKKGISLSPDTLKVAEFAMQQFIDSGSYAGIIVRTVTVDSLLHSASCGYADIESQVPLNENHIFRLFSMSKPLVTAGLMTLYDEGKFTLDDPLADYIPVFRNTLVYTPADDGFTLEEQVTPITIRHLLTHTSGLGYVTYPQNYVDSSYIATGVTTYTEPLEIMVGKLAAIPLKCQPGSKWEYGLSIDVAGYLIEVLSGQPLDKFMKERIFAPLGMDDTSFGVPPEKHNRLTTLYNRDSSGKLQVLVAEGAGDYNNRFKEPAVNFSGGGGLASTIVDYDKFCRMLLMGGELNGKRVLKSSTVDMIMSDQLPEGVSYVEGKIGYGLGASVNYTTGQYGWSGAGSTAFTIYPQTGMAVLGFSQLYPSDHTFSNVYRDYIKKAIEE
jgi:CubicO group peptidase (beta-lactamase class C family)